MGFFSVGVLNVNNIRDIETDKMAGKNSLPVRIGREAAIRYHIMLLQGGLLLSIIFVILNFQSWIGFLFVLVNVLFIKHIKAVKNKPSKELDPHLKQMAISALIFSLLFSLGQILSFFI